MFGEDGGVIGLVGADDPLADIIPPKKGDSEPSIMFGEDGGVIGMSGGEDPLDKLLPPKLKEHAPPPTENGPVSKDIPNDNCNPSDNTQTPVVNGKSDMNVEPDQPITIPSPVKDIPTPVLSKEPETIQKSPPNEVALEDGEIE